MASQGERKDELLNQELEKFRRQWERDLQSTKQPVNASNASTSNSLSDNASTSSRSIGTERRQRKSSSTLENLRTKVAHAQPAQDQHEDEYQSLDVDRSQHNLSKATELPSTALEYYEAAVEKEREGYIDESLKLYRKSFKLDDQVHDRFKEKHFPRPNVGVIAPKDQLHVQPEPVKHELLSTKQLIETIAGTPILPSSEIALSGKEPKNAPCPIATLPREILLQVLEKIADNDVASFVRLASTCKALCFLVYTERRIWKEICASAWGNMVWGPLWRCDLKGQPIISQRLGSSSSVDSVAVEGLSRTLDDLDLFDESVDESLLKPLDEVEVLKYGDYRQMFIDRPRIRYNGIYISTCTYHRPGHPVTNNLTLSNPVHRVTYYRYLRFFPSGFLLTLLTAAEPSEVVYSMTLDTWKQISTISAAHGTRHHSHTANNVPTSLQAVKGMLPGRWKMAFNPFKAADETVDGKIDIETEGSAGNGRHTFIMELSLKMRPKGIVGRRGFGDRLNWISYSSWNRLTDDRGSFSLRNDKPFYFSRVKAYDREGSSVA